MNNLERFLDKNFLRPGSAWLPTVRPDPEPNPLQETNLTPPVARPNLVLVTSAALEVTARIPAGSRASTRPTTGTTLLIAAQHKHRTGPRTGGKASAFQRGF